MPFLKDIDYAIIQVIFSAASTKDLIFNLFNKEDSRRVEYYPNNYIDRPFSKIGIHNLSEHQLVYTIDDDGYKINKPDKIVLTQSGGNGIKTVPSGMYIFENRTAIHRIRLNLAGSGNVELALYV